MHTHSASATKATSRRKKERKNARFAASIAPAAVHAIARVVRAGSGRVNAAPPEGPFAAPAVRCKNRSRWASHVC